LATETPPPIPNTIVVVPAPLTETVVLDVTSVEEGVTEILNEKRWKLYVKL